MHISQVRFRSLGVNKINLLLKLHRVYNCHLEDAQTLCHFNGDYPLTHPVPLRFHADERQMNYRIIVSFQQLGNIFLPIRFLYFLIASAGYAVGQSISSRLRGLAYQFGYTIDADLL